MTTSRLGAFKKRVQASWSARAGFPEWWTWAAKIMRGPKVALPASLHERRKSSISSAGSSLETASMMRATSSESFSGSGGFSGESISRGMTSPKRMICWEVPGLRGRYQPLPFMVCSNWLRGRLLCLGWFSSLCQMDCGPGDAGLRALSISNPLAKDGGSASARMGEKAASSNNAESIIFPIPTVGVRLHWGGSRSIFSMR